MRLRSSLCFVVLLLFAKASSDIPARDYMTDLASSVQPNPFKAKAWTCPTTAIGSPQFCSSTGTYHTTGDLQLEGSEAKKVCWFQQDVLSGLDSIVWPVTTKSAYDLTK